MGFENRESKRNDTLNLLDYVVIDESGNPVNRAMARTLNVSENGILLETHLPLDEGQKLIITLGLENDLCEIKGKIVRIVSAEEDKYSYGIVFYDVEEKDAAILKDFLEEFNKEN